MPKPCDVAVVEVAVSYEDYAYRAPLKFGGKRVTEVTLANVTARVRDRQGREAVGNASMPLGNIWSWPSAVYGYAETLSVMKTLGGRIARITQSYGEYGHPVEIAADLEPAWERAAQELQNELDLREPIPKLCTLVTASPFDAALHDAYGRLLGLNIYNAYGPEFMNRDLAHYLTLEFAGEYLDRYTLRQPRARMPLYHLVGALDPLAEGDIPQRLNDGYPETLGEWIEADGLTHLKIKLNGDDLAWDVQRVLAVERVAAETQARLGVSEWRYSADFNEKCPNVDYLLAFLRQIEQANPAALKRIQYIEQPTSRYLKEHRENKMHAAAQIIPVVIDEALVDFEHLQLAMALGYSGVALKTCKGQSQALLMGAAAQKYGLFLCVQDLTLVGDSFIHSAGLAARLPGVAAIEGNGRQYCPAANVSWAARWPEVFAVRQGTISTGELTLPGLGHHQA